VSIAIKRFLKLFIVIRYFFQEVMATLPTFKSIPSPSGIRATLRWTDISP
jgi:hypothetical protein